MDNLTPKLLNTLSIFDLCESDISHILHYTDAGICTSSFDEWRNCDNHTVGTIVVLKDSCFWLKAVEVLGTVQWAMTTAEDLDNE